MKMSVWQFLRRVWSIPPCAILVCFLSVGASAVGGQATPPARPAPQAGVAEIVTCAEQRHLYNVSAFSGYKVRVSSVRQGYTLDGKLAEDFKIVKQVDVAPTGRKEVFEQGSKNGEAASYNDFWMEKLGMSKKYNAESMNLFAQEMHDRYLFVSRGVESVEGREAWRLAFQVKEKGSNELQKGLVWIDQATCGVIKAEGSFPTVWVTERVEARLALTEVQPGLWLPMKQTVDMDVSMPLMKRKARMIDEFSAYQVRAAP